MYSKKMKRNYLILLVVAIALLVIFGFFKKDINFVSNQGGNQNTSQNLIYENSDFGFRFEYPNRYKVEEKHLGNGERKHTSIVLLPKDFVPPEGGEGPTTISVDIYQNNLDKQSIEAWIKGTAFSNYKLSDGKLTSLTIDGKEALTYTWDGLYRGQTIVFSHNDNIVALSVTYLSPEDQILKDFDVVFNSFKLITNSSPKLPQTIIENYLKENISKISPEKEVLGGKFYLTDVTISSASSGTVSYEDGHVAFTADFNYTVTPEGEVKISNFVVRK